MDWLAALAMFPVILLVLLSQKAASCGRGSEA